MWSCSKTLKETWLCVWVLVSFFKVEWKLLKLVILLICLKSDIGDENLVLSWFMADKFGRVKVDVILALDKLIPRRILQPKSFLKSNMCIISTLGP